MKEEISHIHLEGKEKEEEMGHDGIYYDMKMMMLWMVHREKELIEEEYDQMRLELSIFEMMIKEENNQEMELTLPNHLVSRRNMIEVSHHSLEHQEENYDDFLLIKKDDEDIEEEDDEGGDDSDGKGGGVMMESNRLEEEKRKEHTWHCRILADTI